jgi:hypothetical protein
MFLRVMVMWGGSLRRMAVIGLLYLPHLQLLLYRVHLHLNP